MTSFAFILGVLPLVISSGSGSEMRQAVGVAVFFGMIGVTLFGLMFTPVFYMLIRRLFPGSVVIPSADSRRQHLAAAKR
jgi:multidrug efflux pump subunit AcrB